MAIRLDWQIRSIKAEKSIPWISNPALVKGMEESPLRFQYQAGCFLAGCIHKSNQTTGRLCGIRKLVPGHRNRRRKRGPIRSCAFHDQIL